MKNKHKKVRPPHGRRPPMTQSERDARQRKHERRFTRALQEAEIKEFVEKYKKFADRNLDDLDQNLELVYADDGGRERDNG